MEYEISSNESVSTAVVRVISAIDGRKPESLPPLTDVLDPTALDRLFAGRASGAPRKGGRVSFIYVNCRVTIDNGEFLTIHPFDTRTRTKSIEE